MSFFILLYQLSFFTTLLAQEQPVIEVCGFKFTEGPLWVEELGWIFSDIPANTVYKLANHEVCLTPSGNSNGLGLDKEGNILLAEHGNRRISRLRNDRTIDVVIEKYQGKRFNSPNDLVVRSDGTIFFTDPPYGLPGGLDGPNAELDFCGIYEITPKGDIRLINKNLKRPNGIALSRDEKVLFVADTGQDAVFKFLYEGKEYPIEGMKFCDVASPDGIKIDKQDNLWVTSSEGVIVFNSKGERIDIIKVPKHPANCAFGGKNGDEFLVTARDCVYLYRLKKEK
ncbi:MAG: SMP-30/gluconolactonase/LRE family protein [Candidatus Hydrogenedens sp.]